MPVRQHVSLFITVLYNLVVLVERMGYIVVKYRCDYNAEGRAPWLQSRPVFDRDEHIPYEDEDENPVVAAIRRSLHFTTNGNLDVCNLTPRKRVKRERKGFVPSDQFDVRKQRSAKSQKITNEYLRDMDYKR